MTGRSSVIGLFALCLLSACAASSEHRSRADTVVRPAPRPHPELPLQLLSSTGAARWIAGEHEHGVSLLDPRAPEASSRSSGARLTAIEDGVPHVSIDATEIASPELRRRLTSSLPQTLAIEVAALDPRDMRLIARGSQRCRVLHDAWAQRFEVSVTRGTSVATRTMSDVDEVVAACLRASDLPIGSAPSWTGTSAGEAAYAVWVELDPSDGTQARGEHAEQTFRLGAEDDARTDVPCLCAPVEPTCGTAPHHRPQ